MIITIIIITMTIIIIISSLRAFRRARDGEAKGRVDWKVIRWPDAKFEMAGAKCDLRNYRTPVWTDTLGLLEKAAKRGDGVHVLNVADVQTSQDHVEVVMKQTSVARGRFARGNREDGRDQGRMREERRGGKSARSRKGETIRESVIRELSISEGREQSDERKENMGGSK